MSREKIMLNREEANYFFKNMPDAFFLMDILLDEAGQPCDFRYVYVNDAARQMTEGIGEDFIGRSYKELFGSETPVKWLQPYYEAAYQNKSRTFREYSNELSKYVEVSCFPFSYGCAACFVKNITEQTLYEKTINSARLSYREIYFIDLVKDFYQNIFPDRENGERGCYSVAIPGHFQNGKIVSRNIEEIQNFLSLANIRENLKDKDYMELKYQRISPEGVPEWCLTSIAVCERVRGEAVNASMSIRSIDEIVKTEERQQKLLEEALEEARRASMAKTDFLSSMSHDMRTPLNVIVGMGTLARLHENDPEMVRDSLEKIEVSSKHLLALVNGVLDMAKIESGEIELDESAFSLCDMMENIVLMTQTMISAKHQILNFSLKNPTHENVIGDENRITQAMLNVLSNAVKYTGRHGRIVVNIEELEYDDSTALYRFIISDNGRGMSREFQEHAFDSFTREVDTRLNKEMGTGLGLAITKKIIDKMGGSIQLHSEPGKGSEFIIEIPLEIQRSGLNEMTFPGEKVLVVDDYTPCIDSICSIVDALEAQHFSASTAERALQLLDENQGTEHPFTAVILDYIMPDMNGITLARRIREKYGKELPIIMVSAYDYSLAKKEAVRAGIDFFCTKPVFRSQLLRIFPYLRNKDAMREEKIKLMPSARKRLKGLLAEDNFMNATIARNMLEHLGFEIVTAEDGKDALDCFCASKYHEFDCIFMDVQMPVMDGLTAARAIRSLARPDSDVPIFALTANVFTEDIRRTREAGMQEHIGKPIELVHLRHLLHRYFPDQVEEV